MTKSDELDDTMRVLATGMAGRPEALHRRRRHRAGFHALDRRTARRLMLSPWRSRHRPSTAASGSPFLVRCRELLCEYFGQR